MMDHRLDRRPILFSDDCRDRFRTQNTSRWVHRSRRRYSTRERLGWWKDCNWRRRAFGSRHRCSCRRRLTPGDDNSWCLGLWLRRGRDWDRSGIRVWWLRWRDLNNMSSWTTMMGDPRLIFTMTTRATASAAARAR